MSSSNRQKLQIVERFISFLLTIACCAFVIYQTDKCIKKYKAYPKSTELSIEKVSKHDYPDMSFCRSDFSGFENELKQCNLTRNDYIKEYKWTSNISEECMDPKNLYLKITGKPSDIIKQIDIVGTVFENHPKCRI